MSRAPSALIPRPQAPKPACTLPTPPLLQSYFQQAGTSALNDPLLMQAQVPFRGTAGLPMMPGVFPAAVSSDNGALAAGRGRLGARRRRRRCRCPLRAAPVLPVCCQLSRADRHPIPYDHA